MRWTSIVAKRWTAICWKCAAEWRWQSGCGIDMLISPGGRYCHVSWRSGGGDRIAAVYGWAQGVVGGYPRGCDGQPNWMCPSVSISETWPTIRSDSTPTQHKGIVEADRQTAMGILGVAGKFHASTMWRGQLPLASLSQLIIPNAISTRAHNWGGFGSP